MAEMAADLSYGDKISCLYIYYWKTCVQVAPWPYICRNKEPDVGCLVLTVVPLSSSTSAWRHSFNSRDIMTCESLAVGLMLKLSCVFPASKWSVFRYWIKQYDNVTFLIETRGDVATETREESSLCHYKNSKAFLQHYDCFWWMMLRWDGCTGCKWAKWGVSWQSVCAVLQFILWETSSNLLVFLKLSGKMGIKNPQGIASRKVSCYSF